MLRRLIANRDAFAPLFWTPYTESGHHTRRWLEEAMVRFCEAAADRRGEGGDIDYHFEYPRKKRAANDWWLLSESN